MNSLSSNIRPAMLRNLIGSRGLHSTSGRFYWTYPGWWFEDHKARRWPRTEEERKAAAIRYGIRDEDYQPVPEDFRGGTGDYPNLGEIQYGVKDPYENWSFDKFRRNFGEPVPYDFNVNLPDRYTYTKTEQYQGWGIIWEWLKWYAVAWAFIFLCLDAPVRVLLPYKPKQYAYDYNYAYPTYDPKLFPLTNYTFEPADEGPKIEMGKHH